MTITNRNIADYYSGKITLSSSELLKQPCSLSYAITEHESHFKDEEISELSGNSYFKNYYAAALRRPIEPSNIVVKIGDHEFTLPYKLKKISEVIAEAQSLLDLEDDWDDAGAQATDINTFINTVTFLISYSHFILKVGVIEEPFIDIMRDGSISVLWETEKATLLIIFKKGNTELSYFYAEEKQTKVPFKYAIVNKGDVDEIVALWMSKHLT